MLSSTGLLLLTVFGFAAYVFVGCLIHHTATALNWAIVIGVVLVLAYYGMQTP